MSKKVYVKPYPKEFREQVVKLVQLGDRSALEVAREFEISVDSVRRWVQQAERDQGRRQDGLSSPERGELVRLRREIRRLRMEREILSKAAAWASPPAATTRSGGGRRVGGRERTRR